MTRFAPLSLLAFACWAQNNETSQPPSAKEIFREAVSEMHGSDHSELLPVIPQTPADYAKVFAESAPRPAPASNPKPAAPVSVQRLLHKTPKAAQKAYDRAAKLSRSKKFAEATRELENAVRIDPEFAEAHANLGTQYFRLARYQDAETAFQRSLSLEPYSVAVVANLAMTQLVLGEVQAAASTAQLALSLDNQHARAHYILGAALLRLGDNAAWGHLEQAAPTVTEARELLKNR